VLSEDEEFNQPTLAKSIKKIGQLYPSLVNQDGKVMDGNHRLDANPGGEKKVIHTVNRYEELMIRGNAHYRRRISKEETQQLILEMAREAEKLGLHKSEIAAKLVEDLPYSQSYILRLLPGDYKNVLKAEAGQKGADLVQHNQLVEALDTAEFPNCPICTREPTKTSSQGLPWVTCLAGHIWNLRNGTTPAAEQTGRTGSYIDRMRECAGGCGLMFDKDSLDQNGLCDRCREKAAAKKKAEAPAPVNEDEIKAAADREIREALGMPEPEAPGPAQPENTRQVKEIDFERVGRNCPCCGRPISPEAYERSISPEAYNRIKKAFSEKYPGLFKD
jgi:hypothetical protein